MATPYDKLIADAIAKRDAALSDNTTKNGLSQLAYGIAGADRPSGLNDYYAQQAQQANNPINDVINQSKLDSTGQDIDLKNQEVDPNNARANSLRSAMKSLYPEGTDLSGLTVKDSDSIFKPAQLMENIKQRQLDAEGRREDRSIQRDQTKAMRDQQRADKETAQTDKQVENLSKHLADSGLDSLDSIANDLKGVGVLDGTDDIPGYGMTAALPDFAISDKGKQTRQAVSSLKNVILKARSGGSVTPNEADRMLAELGDGVGRSDAQLRLGIKNTLKQLQAKASTITAGVPQQAVAAFQSRGGKIPSFQQAEAPPRGGASKTPTSEDIDKMSEEQLKAFLAEKR